VSTVWETHRRVLWERLDAFAKQLRHDDAPAPPKLEELTVRLLTGVLMLLRQHRINKRGQCRYCGWTRLTWRLWRRRPQCTVYRSLDFVMGQPLDLVRQHLVTDAPE
jgi:hypothetical protein